MALSGRKPKLTIEEWQILITEANENRRRSGRLKTGWIKLQSERFGVSGNTIRTYLNRPPKRFASQAPCETSCAASIEAT